jgi:hypothetical protein
MEYSYCVQIVILLLREMFPPDERGDFYCEAGHEGLDYLTEIGVVRPVIEYPGVYELTRGEE